MFCTSKFQAGPIRNVCQKSDKADKRGLTSDTLLRLPLHLAVIPSSEDVSRPATWPVEGHFALAGRRVTPTSEPQEVLTSHVSGAALIVEALAAVRVVRVGSEAVLAHTDGRQRIAITPHRAFSFFVDAEVVDL